jgi:Fuc2NAc and GlcNAc transferase
MSLMATVMVLSALVVWGVTAWVRHRAEALRLVQAPNHRSSHDHPTPNGGGLGIVVAGSLAGVGLGLFSGWTISWFVLELGALLAAVGLRDDIQHLPARVRFGAEVAVCAGLLFALGDLPSISFRVGLEFELGGWVLSGLLLLAGVWWINLFNFMDGIDGIAWAQAVFMLLGATALAAWTNANVVSSPVWMLMLCVATATVGFLLLNWPPAKIFMGDVGSTWLAFVVFALALLSVQAGWLSYATWLVFAAVFVTDATMTLLTRLLHGERWYEAHRNHAYQKLARRWGGHRPDTLRAVAVNMLWLAPLAGTCTAWPQWAFGWVLLAYPLLVVGAMVLGAGRPDDA